MSANILALLLVTTATLLSQANAVAQQASSAPPPISFGQSPGAEPSRYRQGNSMTFADAPNNQDEPVNDRLGTNRATESGLGNTLSIESEPTQNIVQEAAPRFDEPAQATMDGRPVNAPDGGAVSTGGTYRRDFTLPLQTNAIVDPAMRHAAYVSDDPNARPESVAGQIIQGFDARAAIGALPGQPITLTELMAMTPFESRPSMIRAYWQAFEKWALQVAAQNEASQLAQLQQPGSNIERDLLAAAVTLANSKLLETQIDLEAAQRNLRQFVPANGADVQPLPADLPLVDEYVTNYEILAAQSPFNPRLNQINRDLPKVLQIIQSRADAAAKSQATARQAIQACNQSQLTLANALEAIRMNRDAHQQFIAAVHRYNQQIAEYALAVAPYGQPAEQAVGMLIKTPLQLDNPRSAIASAIDAPRAQRPAVRPETPKVESGRLAPVQNPPTSAINQPQFDSPRIQPLRSTTAFGSADRSNALRPKTSEPPVRPSGAMLRGQATTQADTLNAADSSQNNSLPPITNSNRPAAPNSNIFKAPGQTPSAATQSPPSTNAPFRLSDNNSSLDKK